jgi:hypothetical protein
MTERTFSLKPFSSTDALSGLKIDGSIIRDSGTLEVRFNLTGPLSEIVIPVISDSPARKDRLWEETCLEIFLAPHHSDHYWEFNLSPAGHWNVYSFRAYREGMKEEPAFTSLPISISSQPNPFQLFMKTGLDNIVPPDQRIDASVSVVLKPAQSKPLYWALTHTGPEPDFHRRDSFALEL